MKQDVPLAALLLGFAGLVPPAILTVVAVLDVDVFAPSMPGFVRSYAAVILSFLGGTWWAFALRSERPAAGLLAVSVLPALAGWAAMFWFKPAEALFALGILLLLALVVDAVLVRRRLAPSWWLKLRAPLSLGLAACCLLSGWVLTR